MLAILGCCCQAESSSCHWGMGGHRQPAAPGPAPTPGQSSQSFSPGPQEAASFVCRQRPHPLFSASALRR